MKMSIVSAVIAAASSTITPLVSASLRIPTSQTLSVHHKRIANTAKRRRPTATLYNGIHTNCRTNTSRRRRALSSALQSPTQQHTAFISHYPTIRHLSNSNNNHPPDDDINWTPICERYLNQAYNQISRRSSYSNKVLQISPQGTEGFRDATRGGQGYIKPRGGSRVESTPQTQYEKEIAASPQYVKKIASQKSQGKSIQQSQKKGTQKESTSSTNNKSNKQPIKKKKRIPFPKMTPGRQRNYRPPHVISALQSSVSFGSHEKYTSVNDAYNDRFSINDDDINGDSGIGVGRDRREVVREEEMKEEEDGCDADDIREHCLENFRDGVESAQYLSVKGPISVSPSSTTKNVDNLEEESSIENFRESTSSKRSPSYKEVVDKLSTISKNNEIPSSNNFRDSAHERKMSVYKDSAFNVPLSEYVEERKKLVEVEAEGKTSSSSSDSVIDEELLDEDIVDEENLSSDSTISDTKIDEEIDKIIRQRKKFEQSIRDEDDDMDSEAVKKSDTRKKESKVSKPSSLLSIDPKSINIIPVKKGKAEEEGLSTIDDADNDDNILKRSSDSLNERSNNTPLPSSGSLFSKWEGASSGSKSFVKMFRGSASYIANHRSTLAVYHIPGELLAWEGFPGLMDDIALTWLLGMKIVLVAGCRHQIDLRLEEEDDEEDEYGGNDKNLGGRVMMSSIRVTDEDTLRVVKEEAGFVRFEIERRLAKSLRLHGGLVKGSESLVGNVVSGNFYSAQVRRLFCCVCYSCLYFCSYPSSSSFDL